MKIIYLTILKVMDRILKRPTPSLFDLCLDLEW